LRAFAQLRQLYDSSTRFADLRAKVLWYYKWIVERLPEHADVPLETIERMFTDMSAFYASENESLRPYYGLRCYAAVVMGDEPASDEWYTKWQHTPAGDSDDCAACEIDRMVLYLLSKRDITAAFEAIEPLLKGECGCEETPQTYSRLLAPSLAGEERENLGHALLAISLRYIRKTPKMLASLGRCIVYLTMTGGTMYARRLVLVALARAATSTNDFARFHAYRAAGFALSSLAMSGVGTVRLPRTELDRGEPILTPDAAELAFAHARSIATKLDARNGTPLYTEGLESLVSSVRDAIEGMQQAVEGEDDEA
jgi:hypothetical protein